MLEYFGTNNYVLFSEFENRETTKIWLKEKAFIKIAKKMSLSNWDDAIVFFENGFTEILSFLITKPVK